jgi:hypothetical protein
MKKIVSFPFHFKFRKLWQEKDREIKGPIFGTMFFRYSD